MSSQNNPRRQSTFRAHGERGYTKLRNDFLQNPKHSHEMIGAVAQMLSRSPEWQHTASGIAATSPSGIKKVWRILREAQEAGLIRRAQHRENDGTFAVFDYLVSDDPATLIRACAEEIHEIQAPSPRTQNGGAVPHSPQRCAVKRSTANGTQEIKESRNEKSEQKKIYLSPRSAPNTESPIERELDEQFKELWKAISWNANYNRKAALVLFAKLSEEERQLAIEAAPHYDRLCRQKGADHRVSINRFLQERMFDDYVGHIETAKQQERAELRSALVSHLEALELDELQPVWRKEVPLKEIPLDVRAEANSIIAQMKADRRHKWFVELSGRMSARTREDDISILASVINKDNIWPKHLYGPFPTEPDSIHREHFSDILDAAIELAARRKAA